MLQTNLAVVSQEGEFAVGWTSYENSGKGGDCLRWILNNRWNLGRQIREWGRGRRSISVWAKESLSTLLYNIKEMLLATGIPVMMFFINNMVVIKETLNSRYLDKKRHQNPNPKKQCRLSVPFPSFWCSWDAVCRSQPTNKRGGLTEAGRQEAVT